MKQKIIVLSIIYAILFMWLLPVQSRSDVDVINTKYDHPKLIYVELVGAVVYPGRYTFYSEITTHELIAYAAGLTSDADISLINFNEVITKSTNIYIKEKTNSGTENNNSQFLVNINEATFMQLLAIPNITEKRAANIIIYREANGLFLNKEQLINVKGIGSATFEKISGYVTTK